MTPRIQPKYLLLDADVIIYLHAANLWQKLTTAYEVSVPAQIVHEAQFFYDAAGERQPINLAAEVESGHIIELSAEATDLLRLRQRLTTDLLEGLHPGEAEALALILVDKYRQGFFCTGDKTAIRILAALGFAERGVALETALQTVGWTLNAQIRTHRQLTAAYFITHIEAGKRRRLTGGGLASSLFDDL